MFPNFWAFAQRYCGAKRNRFGWDFGGATNTEELHNVLTKNIMIRRKKADVLKELPPKQICKVPLAINNRAEYQKAELDFINYISNKFEGDLRALSKRMEMEAEEFSKIQGIQVSAGIEEADIKTLTANKVESVSKAQTLVQMEILKQLAVKGKLKHIIEWIQNFLDGSDEKLVVFMVHRAIVDELYEHFKTIAVKLYGGISANNRQKAVDAFQTNPDIRLFIGNIDAAGVGITLTSASNAVVGELPWNPGKLSQAADRIHRITQTKQVTIYMLIAMNTIEEAILDLIQSKQEVLDQVLDGKKAFKTTLFEDLINYYRNKK
jgi:SWI/SNF-related matrix-associated actin-dependent regulator 1 of chromatin subfamily A